jgi:phosphatidylserine/phosphatidylglycerophosphate/cardiolipin synthase-like enzyme
MHLGERDQSANADTGARSPELDPSEATGTNVQTVQVLMFPNVLRHLSALYISTWYDSYSRSSHYENARDRISLYLEPL